MNLIFLVCPRSWHLKINNLLVITVEQQVWGCLIQHGPQNENCQWVRRYLSHKTLPYWFLSQLQKSDKGPGLCLQENSLVEDTAEVGEHLQWLNKATLSEEAKWSTEAFRGGNENHTVSLILQVDAASTCRFMSSFHIINDVINSSKVPNFLILLRNSSHSFSL